MKIFLISCFQALFAIRPRCKPDTVESRAANAHVIFSTTCERYETQTGICLQARIWRVMKGVHHLENVHGKSTTLTEYGEDITLPIYGFGDRAICKSKIRQGETKIIFAKTARDGTILTLASSPLSISHGNLEKIEALSKGELVEDKCAGSSCSFGAVCDPTSGKCECVDMRCEQKEATAVCGSDGVTYLNECELEQAQCREQKRVSLQYHGLCRDVQVAEIECRRDDECHNGSICNVGICRCPACDDDAPADVCGNDGNTYRSECDLNRRKCKENINDLAVEHAGICRVCNPIYWDGVATRNSRYCEGSCLECENEPFSTIVCATKGSLRRVFASECLAKCSMGDDVDLTVGGCYEPPCEECRDKECKLFGTEWKCNCPLCPAENNPVCGSDGVTYSSICVMKRTNCEFGSGIELVSSGSCPEKGEEEDQTCENGCFFGAYCERGRCKCDYNCKIIERPVCGDNHIGYKNECFLREFECEIQQPVAIAKSGHCSAENDQKNCPIYTTGVERTVNGVECHCPECDHHFGDSTVCGSDGKLYDSRCELRSQACHFNEQIFEVPLDHCGLEIEGSGGGEVCKFGGVDASDRFDDDEEFSNQIYCRCNWHCEDGGAQVVAEGVVFDNLCKYYRDGNCKNQRELVITKSNCHCNNPGAYDRDGPCDHVEGCLCKPGYKGKHCELCELNFYQLNGRCVQCSCSQLGSRGALCDENGQCFCKAGFIGQKCDIKLEQDPDRDQCQACSAPEIESGAVCGDDHRIYGSRCAMRRLHCNKKRENQPEAVKYFKQCLFSGYPQIEIDDDESSEESEIMEDIITLPILPPTQEPAEEAEGSGGYVDPQFSTCDDEECENNSISLSEAKLPQDSSIDFDSIRYDVVLTLKNDMDWNDKERIETDLSAVFASELSEINLKSAVIDKIEERSAILSIEISPDKPYLQAKINSYLQENTDRSSFSQFNIVHGQWFGGESFERYSFERCDTTYEFEIKFKFRTRDPNGVIFWAGSPDALDKSLALKIKDSKLELSFAKNEPYRYKKAVDDNVWHTVELKFNRGGITLILDHIPRPEYIATGKKDSRELDLSNIFIGGIPKEQELDILSSLEINKGLTGCFQMIGGSAMKSGVSENKDYPIKSVYSYGIAKCDGRSPCQNNLDECDKDDSCVEWNNLRFCEAAKGPHRSQGVKMNGSSILMFDSEEPKRISSVEIEFESTAGKRSYGLLHLSNSLVLSVDERRLRLDLSLDGTDNAGMLILEDQFPLEDAVSTRVRLEFKSRKVVMKMCQDKCRDLHSQTKSFNRRTPRFDSRLVIGQIHPSAFSRLSSSYFQRLVGFHGVFKSLKLNDEQLALWQDADLRRMVAPAYEPVIPQARKTGPVKFNNEGKYFNFVTEPLTIMDEVRVQMKIKVQKDTEKETIYFSGNELGTSSLKIHVRSGYLVVRLEIEDIEDGNDVFLELESLYRIDHDEWTNIEVVYKKEQDVGFRTLNLLIDNGAYADSDVAFTTVDFVSDGFIFLGGMQNSLGDSVEGFSGCVDEVVLNSRQLDLRQNLIEAPEDGLREGTLQECK